MVVVKVVDPDVAEKVDTQFISEHFQDLENVNVVFICTEEGGEEDDWTDGSGIRNMVIHLPYGEVVELTDVRPMMLERVEEGLGLVV